MAKGAKKRTARLGRGLSSLMSGGGPAAVPIDAAPPADPNQPKSEAELNDVGDQSSTATHNGLVSLKISQIEPNPYQPRQRFNEESLQSLSESIRHDGVMQPIIVRGPVENGQYQIIAGERRWRACQLADIQSVPAIIRDLSDQDAAEWALIENIQREDLNPIEQAEAFQALLDRYQLSHDQIADRAGINRSTVSNTLRLLNLHDDVRRMLLDGLLSAGQGRAIAGLSDGDAQKKLAIKAVRQNWSVRQVESAVRQMNSAPVAGESGSKSGKAGRATYLADLQKQIGQQLGTKVQVKAGRKKGTGTLSIDFYSFDQFEELLAKLGVKTDT